MPAVSHSQLSRSLRAAHSIADLRLIARRRLPRMVFDYIDGAADQEITARRNVTAFDEIALVPRILRATPDCDTSMHLLGDRISMPVLITPTGFTGIVWPKGEAAVARAAAAAGTTMVVSAASSLSLEEIAAETAEPKWFQQFIYKDRGVTLDLANRAREAGYRALVLTADVQAPGNRYRDLRNGFTVPPQFKLGTAFDMLRRFGWGWQMLTHPRVSFPNFEHYGKKDAGSIAEWLNELIDPAVSWDDVAWLRAHWPGKLVIKGIMHPDDADKAIDVGADVVMVSNHGGRQLDTGPASLEVLPHIVETVAGRVPVIIDGGIRHGTHVLKSIALGAQSCLIGRAYLWGLAAGGQAGVELALALLKREMERSMAQGGWNRLSELSNSDVVQRAPLLLGKGRTSPEKRRRG